jgi:hypothetical protein
MVKRTEADIKRAIEQYLKARGCLVVPFRNTGLCMPDGRWMPARQKGIADLLGLDPAGKFFSIEVKKPGGRVTPEQVAFLESVRSFGCKAFIAYSVNDVMENGL